MLTNFRSWIRRAVRGVKRPTVGIKTAGLRARLTVEALEDRTLLAASSLILSGFPLSATAGAVNSLTVTANDPTYTGTIVFTSTDAHAILPASYTFTPADQGAHTFSVTLESAGTQSLTATDTTTGTLTGTESGIAVSPGAASRFVVSGFPTSDTAGAAGSLTVTALDAFGNVATGYTGTVQLNSSDAQAALPASYTFTTADAGVHSFSATLKTAGTQSVTVTDTLSGSLTGTESGIAVSPAAASTLVVSGFPVSDTAGAAHSVTVTAKDAYGNVATGYTGTVQLSSSDAQAALPGNYTFTAADAGVSTFVVALKTAGTQSLTVTDTVTGSLSGTQGGIAVSPAAASVLVVSGFPTSDTAGAAGSLTVTARDAFGNVATGYTGTVRLSSSDAQAALPGSYTFVAADQGVHTFGATLKTAGTQTLTATDTVSGGLTGTEAGISVTPAAIARLVVGGFPTTDTAGAAGSLTVTAKDAFGNTATGYTGTVRLTSTDAQAGLPANYAFTAGDAGVHTFSVTLKTAGTQAITVTDTVSGSFTGTESGIAVSPAATSVLVVSGFPTSDTAGAAGSLTVTARDAYGNTTTGYTGTVRLTSTDGQALLPASYTFATADAGVHTFSATLKTTGTQSLTATDTVTGSLTGTESGITVSPTAATSLVIGGFPTSATAGAAGSVTVTARDAYGNVATSYTGTVRLTSSDAQAMLPASYAFTAGDAGAHTFSVTLKTAGTHSLTVIDTVQGSLTGTEGGISVSPAAASSLVLSGFPTAVSAGLSWNVTATVRDAFGNLATNFTGTVQFSSSDAQAVLPANYTFTTADAGVHVFGAALKTAGTQSLTVTDTVNPALNGTQSGITVNRTWAHPELVTLSFVPDGTLMASGTNGPIYSDMFAKFNARFGSTAAWENAIITAAQTWAAVAGFNLSIVNDNGTASGQGAFQQGDPGMGDIRVGSYAMSAGNVLGLGYYPPGNNNYSIAGDISFNSNQTYNLNGASYDLQTVALHELGHALGLDHSTLYSAVMYAAYHGTTRNLTSDDISRIRAVYGSRTGDAFDTAPTPNNSFQNAADISGRIVPGALTAQVTGLEINATGAADYWKITAPAASGSTLTVNVQSAGLSLLRPSVTVYASDQVTVLGSSSASGSYNGGNVTVNYTAPLLGVNLLGLLSVNVGQGSIAGQTYYIKVTGADNTVFGTGAYALSVSMGTAPLPTVALPNTQVVDGAVLIAGGGSALTADALGSGSQVTPGLEVNDFYTTDGMDPATPPPPPRPGEVSSGPFGVIADSGQNAQGGAQAVTEAARRADHLRDSAHPAAVTSALAQAAALNNSFAALGQPAAFGQGATQATQLSLVLAPPVGSTQAGNVQLTTPAVTQNVFVTLSAQQLDQGGARQAAPRPASGESDTPRPEAVSAQDSEPELREENDSSAPEMVLPAAPVPTDVAARQQATDAVFADPAPAAFGLRDGGVFADPVLVIEAVPGDAPLATFARDAGGESGSAPLALFALLGAGWWSAVSRPEELRTQDKQRQGVEE